MLYVICCICKKSLFSAGAVELSVFSRRRASCFQQHEGKLASSTHTPLIHLTIKSIEQSEIGQYQKALIGDLTRRLVEMSGRMFAAFP